MCISNHSSLSGIIPMQLGGENFQLGIVKLCILFRHICLFQTLVANVLCRVDNITVLVCVFKWDSFRKCHYNVNGNVCFLFHL